MYKCVWIANRSLRRYCYLYRLIRRYWSIRERRVQRYIKTCISTIILPELLEGLSVSWSGRSTEGLGGTGKFGADHYKSVLKKIKIQRINLPNDLVGNDDCRVTGGTTEGLVGTREFGADHINQYSRSLKSK